MVHDANTEPKQVNVIRRLIEIYHLANEDFVCNCRKYLVTFDY